jgi:hypothetical protein
METSRRLTLAVDVRVLLEASLHGPELFNTVDALGLFRAVDETRECGLEVFTAGAVGHAAETRAVPVDLASLLVVGSLLRIGFSLGGLVLDNVSCRRIGSRRLGAAGRVRGLGGAVAIGLFGVDVNRLVRGGLVVKNGVGGSSGLGGDWERY